MTQDVDGIYNGPTREHPARFPDRILAALREVVPKGRILDPFAGVGMLGRLSRWDPAWQVYASEIEPEWAGQCRDNGCAEVHCGDSRRLPWPDWRFDAICTSMAYGNRLSDSYAPKDLGTDEERRSHRTRRSYRIDLGRPLHDANGAGMAWGDAYRQLHWQVILECVRVLKVDGLFVANCKDHVRKGMLMGVPTWWHDALEHAGLEHVRTVRVPLRGDQNTARSRKQGRPTVDHEEILVFQLPRNP